MTLEVRKQAFVELGLRLTRMLDGGDVEMPESKYRQFISLIEDAHLYNHWFIPEFCRQAVRAVADMLTPEKLDDWLARYPDMCLEKPTRKVAVIMAGNIPMVGFHDMLCVLISGNHFIGKLSSKDNQLLAYVGELLCAVNPAFVDRIEWAEGRITDFDAVIATGSNNSARYFDYYFGKYPHLIRKNRNAVAVLDGTETDEELSALADDVFRYFGLGCRSVSKIFVPQGYDFPRLMQFFERYHYLYDHYKYANNYDYQKAILLMNQLDHLDNGFLLLKEDDRTASPVGVLYYAFYQDRDSLAKELAQQSAHLQCVVSRQDVPPGKAQQPELWDYADGVDTVQFLLQINQVNYDLSV